MKNINQINNGYPLGKGDDDRPGPDGNTDPTCTYPYCLGIYGAWWCKCETAKSAVPGRTKHETSSSSGGLSVDFVRGAFPN